MRVNLNKHIFGIPNASTICISIFYNAIVNYSGIQTFYLAIVCQIFYHCSTVDGQLLNLKSNLFHKKISFLMLVSGLILWSQVLCSTTVLLPMANFWTWNLIFFIFYHCSVATDQTSALEILSFSFFTILSLQVPEWDSNPWFCDYVSNILPLLANFWTWNLIVFIFNHSLTAGTRVEFKPLILWLMCQIFDHCLTTVC